jgi:CBS-domain-containing membrane protein
MHIFAKELSKLTVGIEQEFFRIERKNGWAAGCINGLIAGTAVGLVAWLVTALEGKQEGNLLLFACLGSSSASMVFAPLAKSNSLRTIIIAYLIASLVCVVLYPFRDASWFPLPLQCFVAVTLPIAIMRLSDAMHPAAVGSAMAFIIFDRKIESLLLLLLAILGLLTLVKMLAYIYLEELEFRRFPREFSRRYYGTEMTVSIEQDTNDDPQPGIG